VIHVAEGTAAGTISWFKNCNSGVSAQYVMDEAGPSGRWSVRSTGLTMRSATPAAELASSMKATPPTRAIRRQCTSLRRTGSRCLQPLGHSKQKARAAPGIVGHADVTECALCGSHMDPGHGWNWGHYIALVNQVSDPSTFIVESRSGGKNNANYSETGTFGNSSAKSIVWDCTTGIGSRYAYMNGTNLCTYRYTPSTTGTYRVYVTWCTSANATQQLEHIVTHAGGSTSVVFDTDSDTTRAAATCGTCW